MGKKFHRNVYGPVRGRGIWRVGTNEQFCNLHRGTLTVTDIQVTRLELLGNLIRMEINRIFKFALVAKLEFKRNVGKPKLRRLDDIQSDLKMTGINV
jgi:hypothetical protein